MSKIIFWNKIESPFVFNLYNPAHPPSPRWPDVEFSQSEHSLLFSHKLHFRTMAFMTGTTTKSCWFRSVCSSNYLAKGSELLKRNRDSCISICQPSPPTPTLSEGPNPYLQVGQRAWLIHQGFTVWPWYNQTPSYMYKRKILKKIKSKHFQKLHTFSLYPVGEATFLAEFFAPKLKIPIKCLVEAFVGKKYRCIVNLLFRGFRLKSDGADDAKPGARKTLRKENTETYFSSSKGKIRYNIGHIKLVVGSPEHLLTPQKNSLEYYSASLHPWVPAIIDDLYLFTVELPLSLGKPTLA